MRMSQNRGTLKKAVCPLVILESNLRKVPSKQSQPNGAVHLGDTSLEGYQMSKPTRENSNSPRVHGMSG